MEKAALQKWETRAEKQQEYSMAFAGEAVLFRAGRRNPCGVSDVNGNAGNTNTEVIHIFHILLRNSLGKTEFYLN